MQNKVTIFNSAGKRIAEYNYDRSRLEIKDGKYLTTIVFNGDYYVIEHRIVA